MAELPAIGSFLLASADPGRLRGWYQHAFGVTADTDGFLRFGEVNLLVDSRDDVAAQAAEPTRVILNLHVHDAEGDRAASGCHEGDLAGPAGVPRAGRRVVRHCAGPGRQLCKIHRADARVPGRPRGACTPSWPGAAGRYGGLGPAASPGPRTRAALYAEKLGLEPAEARPGGLRYQGRSGSFSIFQSAGRPSGEHAQLAWQVWNDLDAVVAELRQRGVAFEDVNAGGLRTVNGIAEVTGNYPSAGGGERAAWFRDSEGNLLGIGQAIAPVEAGD